MNLKRKTQMTGLKSEKEVIQEIQNNVGKECGVTFFKYIHNMVKDTQIEVIHRNFFKLKGLLGMLTDVNELGIIQSMPELHLFKSGDAHYDCAYFTVCKDDANNDVIVIGYIREVIVDDIDSK